MTSLIGSGAAETVDIGGTALYVLRGGQGSPALVLHGMEGPEGWLAFHDRLSSRRTVYAPSHPGFAETPRPEWMESITHQALFYNWFLQEKRLSDVDLIGFGIGGWIAAEMATMCTHALRRLVLVGAAGIRPQEAEVPDIFIRPWREVVESCVANPDAAAEFQRIYSADPIVDFGGRREAGRSMTMRMCYRPYMYNPALPSLLPRIRVPTLVVWGAQDRIMPFECGQAYQRSIPGARLQVLDACGHWPHFEKPRELADLILEFTEG